MKSTYIERVTAYLKHKKNRENIEAELTDHIALHQEQIGYDEAAALEKAEARMGDADMAGEQLEALEAEKHNLQTLPNVVQ